DVASSTAGGGTAGLGGVRHDLAERGRQLLAQVGCVGDQEVLVRCAIAILVPLTGVGNTVVVVVVEAAELGRVPERITKRGGCRGIGGRRKVAGPRKRQTITISGHRR